MKLKKQPKSKTAKADADTDAASHVAAFGSVVSTETKAQKRSAVLKAKVHGKLRKAYRRFILAPSKAFKDQSLSLLCRLPLELREQIWVEVLRQPEGAKPAHFHIWDTVWDSCTYDPARIKQSRRARKSCLTTASLRTCHAIHDEAVQMLYENAKFELVVLPGRARPEELVKNESPALIELRRNLEKRNCVGRLAECGGLLRRIRYATVVVQAGRHPDMKLYRKHVAKFLEVIDWGKKLKYMCVRFDLHAGMEPSGLAPMVEALLPLKDGQVADADKFRPMARRREVEVVANICPNVDWDAAFVRQQLDSLQHALQLPHHKVKVRGLVSSVAILGASTAADDIGTSACCLVRGVYGRKYYAPSTPPKTTKQLKREKLLENAAGVFCVTVLSPITFVCVAVEYVKRKRDKGESWRVIR